MLEFATLNYDGEIISFINHRLNTFELIPNEHETPLIDYLNKLSLENWEIKGFESKSPGAFVMLQRSEFPNPVFSITADLMWKEYTADLSPRILEQPTTFEWIELENLISFQRGCYVSAAEEIRTANDVTLMELLQHDTVRVLLTNKYDPILWDGNHRMNEALRRGWTRLQMPCVDMENLIKFPSIEVL